MSRALTAALGVGGPGAALAVCRAVVAWLPMTGAAVTLMSSHEGGQEPVCATDAASARIDELQFSLGDGPCVESFRTARAVLVPDIADPAEQRWPIFAAAAADTGARGMFVFPLVVGASIVGVLDCYRDSPGGLDERELAGALRAADAAVWTLLDDVGRYPADDEVSGAEWFDGSALIRAEVHQATGMLIAQASLRAPAALAALRAAAFTQDRTIGEVAGDVVARRLRLEPDGAWRTPRPRIGNPGIDKPHIEDPGEAPDPHDRFNREPDEGENP